MYAHPSQSVFPLRLRNCNVFIDTTLLSQLSANTNGLSPTPPG